MKNQSKIKVILSKITNFVKRNFFPHNINYLILRNNQVFKKQPYNITVKNPTNKPQDFILFGKNIYGVSNNFGSHKDLEISCADNNIKYHHLLEQSASQPFETSKIRVKSSNAAQATQVLSYNDINADGASFKEVIIAECYFSPDQFQSGIVDIPIQKKIHGNSYITSVVFPNTTVTFSIFEKEKETLKQKLIRKLTLIYKVTLKVLYLIICVLIVGYLIEKIIGI